MPKTFIVTGENEYVLQNPVTLKSLVASKASDGLINAFAKEFGTHIPTIDQILDWLRRIQKFYWLNWLIKSGYIKKRPVMYALRSGRRFLTRDGRKIMFCHTGYLKKTGFFVDETFGRRVTRTCAPDSNIFPGLPMGYDVDATKLRPVASA